MFRTLLPAVILAFCTPVFAQAPSDAPKPKGERRVDCSKAKDPKACEERVAKVKAAYEKAKKACEGKTGKEGRDCMSHEMCAQTKDPGKCEAAAARREQIREACKGKTGEELKSCVREQRQAQKK
ncbi:MAG TPA: hypothetical protein VKE95_02180 [Burkholderiales bacterium]|nr:hypothetical protein [Burkholderiales bacterium]